VTRRRALAMTAGALFRFRSALPLLPPFHKTVANAHNCGSTRREFIGAAARISGSDAECGSACAGNPCDAGSAGDGEWMARYLERADGPAGSAISAVRSTAFDKLPWMSEPSSRSAIADRRAHCRRAQRMTVLRFLYQRRAERRGGLTNHDPERCAIERARGRTAGRGSKRRLQDFVDCLQFGLVLGAMSCGMLGSTP